MNEAHLTVPRTARYYTLGQLTDATRHVWFVLHGYGQLAQFFLRRFDVVQNDDTFVVAPEGLSRFYLDGKYDRIGASWMTREDRQHEIEDGIRYLNALWDTLFRTVDPAAVTIHLLGFSQGAVQACRWLQAGQIRADRLILWAGFFPTGLQTIIDRDRLAGVETFYVYGEQDEYLVTIPDIRGYLQQIEADMPGIRLLPYSGRHSVDREVLKSLVY
ncbi:alpha/beta hydrolase [Tellurirhabdus rosea]|uniref:alpha/beta hydrolase n=1 Tax=Tellurirhabdus rosea TaxID=2674997 RepID=UPI00225491D0|nr:phospholipase [Tellurirhabdus rosea]